MTKTFTSNYLKIYFWQAVGFVVKFLSLFVVTPYISKEKSTFGIYAVCISVMIFLNYADLGFLRAGQKYAAESFASNDRQSEMKYIGFGAFILLCLVVPCCAVFAYLGLNPKILISGLNSNEQTFVASCLLFILALFSPFIVMQRVVSQIFEIRLEVHRFQRLTLCSSIITLASVFYFFSGNNYEIVPYFFFMQIMNVATLVGALLLATRAYSYDIGAFLRSIRFDRTVFEKVKAQAFSGLYVMIVWVVFYELDQVAIGKILGADLVAIYAIGFTFATIFRTVYSIFFSPFTVRANHYVGARDDVGLKNFVLKLSIISAPIVALPTVALALVAGPFISSWVGKGYEESAKVAVIFSLLFSMSFVSYVSSMVLIAKERIREMYIVATIQPLIFWGGIGLGLHYGSLELVLFAGLKLLATAMAEVYYFRVLVRYLDISLKEFAAKVIIPIVVPLVLLIVWLTTTTRFLPTEKSHLNLIVVVAWTGLSIVLAMIVQCAFSAELRMLLKTAVLSKLRIIYKAAT